MNVEEFYLLPHFLYYCRPAATKSLNPDAKMVFVSVTEEFESRI